MADDIEVLAEKARNALKAWAQARPSVCKDLLAEEHRKAEEAYFKAVFAKSRK